MRPVRRSFDPAPARRSPGVILAMTLCAVVAASQAACLLLRVGS